MLSNEQVAKNIGDLRAHIAAVAGEHGKEAPLLLAATKTVPVEQINYAIENCGITDIGENRVQELLEKYGALDKSVRLHFIGRLQRNKVKYIVDKVCMIQSLDSLPLALEIEKQAAKIGKTIDVLLEVNTGREEQKGGFLPEDLEDALKEIGSFRHIHVRGLMAVAPICANFEENYKYFEETYQKFIDISEKRLHNIDMQILSMGMSDSIDPAIAAGSTMVRVGSAIFGQRIYQTEPNETK